MERPFIIVDPERRRKIGLVVSSLDELIQEAGVRFEVVVTDVVLETDGTIIRQNKYFDTLEANSTLMILYGDQKWVAAGATDDRYEEILAKNKELSAKIDRLEALIFVNEVSTAITATLDQSIQEGQLKSKLNLNTTEEEKKFEDHYARFKEIVDQKISKPIREICEKGMNSEK